MKRSPLLCVLYKDGDSFWLGVSQSRYFALLPVVIEKSYNENGYKYD